MIRIILNNEVVFEGPDDLSIKVIKNYRRFRQVEITLKAKAQKYPWQTLTDVKRQIGEKLPKQSFIFEKI